MKKFHVNLIDLLAFIWMRRRIRQAIKANPEQDAQPNEYRSVMALFGNEVASLIDRDQAPNGVVYHLPGDGRRRDVIAAFRWADGKSFEEGLIQKDNALQEALKVCRELIEYQWYYQANAHDKFPGNGYYMREGMRIVEMARDVIAKNAYQQDSEWRMVDLENWLAEKLAWSYKTFGTAERSQGVLHHIEKEIEEVRANPADVVEWIDIVLLAFDGAMRMGHTPRQVVNALINKQIQNTERAWGPIPKDDEPSFHVKEQDNKS